MRTAVVLFSGGVDSTYLVFKNADLFERLILLTFKVPGMFNSNFSCRSSSQLIKIFGNKITHNIIDIRDVVYSFRGKATECVKDNLEYGFYSAWCLGCRVAMHISTIKFCVENGITEVLEGSNYYDRESLAQNEDIRDFLIKLYRKDGINYNTPCYYEENISLSKNKLLSLLRRLRLFKDATNFRVKYLKDHNINLGKGFISQYRSTQPSCVTSVCFNLVKAIMNNFHKENKLGYLKYLTDRVNAYRAKNKSCYLL